MMASKSGSMSVTGVLDVDLGVALLGAGIDHREIQLLVRGVQRNEKIEDQIQHLVRRGVVAVNFVDDNNGLGPGLQGLAQDETGLGLGTVGGIDHQQHAVYHVHDALDLAAEVGVAGSIDDVDVVILVFESGVLGADGDAFFPLQVHGIHDAFLGGNGLVGAKGARLFEQAIHQRGLAVVNMGDNSDVANVIHQSSPTIRRAAYCAPSRRKVKFCFKSGGKEFAKCGGLGNLF